jgi:tetratricopeptide (TPR) repeat protein
MLGLLAMTLPVYWRACENGFVNFDDETYVLRNPHIQHGVTRECAKWAFSEVRRAANWHPLTWLSLALDWQLYGPDPAAFHRTNIIFHAVNTALLYLILRLMTGAMWRSAIVAALFALHPLHVESVAWVAERKDVLSTFLGFVTLLAYWNYAREPDLARYLPVPVLLGLGLLAKPMLVTLPCLLLLLDFWPLARVRFRFNARTGMAPAPFPVVSLGMAIVEKLPLLAMTVASSVVTVYAQSEGQALRSFDRFPLLVRVGNACVAYVTYLVRTVFPIGLSVYYPHPENLLPLWLVIVAGIFLAGITLWAWGERTRRPYLLVGWLWYLGMLVPVVGLVQVGLQAMADRYTYLPIIGIFISVVWLASDVLSSWKLPVLACAAVALAPLLGCAILTWEQISYWHDSETLWRHALAVQDSDLGHYNLGQALYVTSDREYTLLQQQGRFKEADVERRKKLDAAVDEFSTAVKITAPTTPTHTQALYNRGVLRAKLGDAKGAMQDFREVIRLEETPEAHYSLGLALANQGKFEKAVAEYRQALRIRPDDLPASNNLAATLAELGKEDEALEVYADILRKDPNNVMTHNNLGLIFLQQGKFDEAIAHFKRALKLQPELAAAYDNLGTALASSGKPGDAALCFQKAIRLQPGVSRYQYHLAHALYGLGERAESRAWYDKAMQLEPAWLQATNRTAWRRATNPDGNIRNGRLGLDLAKLLCEATQEKQPACLDTLAAAYAETGRFDEAVQAVKQAMALTPPAQSATLRALQKRLRLYEEHKPYREPATPRGAA